MNIAVRYQDGTKNLLTYAPSEQFTAEQISQATKEHMEATTGKKVAVVLLQVSETAQVAEKQTA